MEGLYRVAGLGSKLLNVVMLGIIYGTIIGVAKGDTKSSDYASFGLWSLWIAGVWLVRDFRHWDSFGRLRDRRDWFLGCVLYTPPN